MHLMKQKRKLKADVKHMVCSKRVKIETKRDKEEELLCSKVMYCSGVKGNEKEEWKS